MTILRNWMHLLFILTLLLFLGALGADSLLAALLSGHVAYVVEWALVSFSFLAFLYAYVEWRLFKDHFDYQQYLQRVDAAVATLKRDGNYPRGAGS